MRLLNAQIALFFLLVLISCEKKGQDCKDSLTVRLDNVIGMNETTARNAAMREFLWTHWHGKKSGVLLLTFVSKEGSVAHSEFRISMVPVSMMQLKVAIIRDRVGYQGQVIPGPESGYEAYTIERVLSENPYGVGDENKVTVLPNDAIVAPSKYWLRIKDWEGNLVTYF